MAEWRLILMHFLIIKSVFCSDYRICDKICRCDSIRNLIRVTCCDQKINTVDELGVPQNVQILDLSRNRLTNLGNNAFKSYPSILNLIISENSITTLYLDTFSHLGNLLAVNLSHNLLEEFDSRIFEENKKLIDVDLSWNKFMLWQEDRPLLISESIKILSLQNSQLNHIYPSFFMKLPNLEKLDLSHNLLITIFNQQFSHFSKLGFLDLSGNPWGCDRDLHLTMSYLIKKKVQIVNDKCSKKKIEPAIDVESPKFERMLMAPAPLSSTNFDGKSMSKLPIDTHILVRNKHILPFFDETFPSLVRGIHFPRPTPKILVDDRYEQCSKKLEMLQDKYNDLESKITSSDAYFLFFIGVAMGLIGFILSLGFCICLHKTCKKAFGSGIITRERHRDPSRQPNSPFLNTVLERPRERQRRRQRQQYERANQRGSDIPAIAITNRSNLVSNDLDVGHSVIIAQRPETPPPSYFDVAVK